MGEGVGCTAAQRGDTMKQALSLLRDPSPGTNLIPYLGDKDVYEQVLRVAAKDRIAINRNGTWYGPDPGQDFDDALRVLKQRTFPQGLDWGSIQIGLPSEKASGGVRRRISCGLISVRSP